MKFCSSENARSREGGIGGSARLLIFLRQFNTTGCDGVQLGEFAGLSTAKDMLTLEVTAALMALELVRG